MHAGESRILAHLTQITQRACTDSRKALTLRKTDPAKKCRVTNIPTLRRTQPPPTKKKRMFFATPKLRTKNSEIVLLRAEGAILEPVLFAGCIFPRLGQFGRACK